MTPALRQRLKTWFQSQRSQGITEFALIAPVILLMTFGIIDFGRGLYFYITLQQAANEGARVAVRASDFIDANGVGCSPPAYVHCWPTDADVATAVQVHAVTEVLANPCPNGPITGTAPPPGQGWIFITEPDPPATVESLSATLANAPGGQGWANTAGSCSATNPAHSHEPLQVTIYYNFVPFTPMVRQVTANSIIISAAATYDTEY